MLKCFPYIKKPKATPSQQKFLMRQFPIKGARCSVVRRGTMLKAGRLLVRVPMGWIFFFNLSIPSSRTMPLGSTQPLTEMRSINLSGGVKGGRRVRLTYLPPSVSRLSRENMGASTSHNSMGLNALLQG
jgi:hypothetical protein